ncbi:EAL domain-containing protein [Asanoa sp. NPDC050611]|uniref:EAL domain-containing protein n=1 Tax=Asanoa sp. NPDC050611 TaxID=3157098 RepID=UPI0033D6DD9A
MANDFERLLAGRSLETVFQPIVRLSERTTVAYEALVRGPADSPLASADSLLAEAYRAGRVTEFDWVARASACRAALEAGLPPDVPLFLNIEPLAIDSDCPPDLVEAIETAYRELTIVLEVTERSLDRDPATLVSGVARVRTAVGGLAVDDVGANRATLTMLSILEPDVIKLEDRIVQDEPSAHTAEVLECAWIQAERTGALLLAEGVEEAAQVDIAREVGATLVQGYHLGDPGPMPIDPRPPDYPLRLPDRPRWTARTPFDAAGSGRLHRSGARLLAQLAERVEQVMAGEDAGVLLALLPDARLFNAARRDRLAALGRRGVLTGVLGTGLPSDPGDGIRGGRRGADEHLRGQWATVALGPHTAIALLARAAPPAEYEYIVTYDRARVEAAARSLLGRLGPHAP